jgi:hypothetical protein
MQCSFAYEIFEWNNESICLVFIDAKMRDDPKALREIQIAYASMLGLKRVALEWGDGFGVSYYCDEDIEEYLYHRYSQTAKPGKDGRLSKEPPAPPLPSQLEPKPVPKPDDRKKPNVSPDISHKPPGRGGWEMEM